MLLPSAAFSLPPRPRRCAWPMTQTRPRSICTSSWQSVHAPVLASHLRSAVALPPGPYARAEARDALGEDRRAHHAVPFARRGEVPLRPYILGARRGVDLQSAEAEPGLQGAVRAVQRGEGGRRSHRRPHHQRPVSAGAELLRDLHLPNGPRILHRHRRTRPPQGRHLQARRVLRLRRSMSLAQVPSSSPSASRG